MPSLVFGERGVAVVAGPEEPLVLGVDLNRGTVSGAPPGIVSLLVELVDTATGARDHVAVAAVASDETDEVTVDVGLVPRLSLYEVVLTARDARKVALGRSYGHRLSVTASQALFLYDSDGSMLVDADGDPLYSLP